MKKIFLVAVILLSFTALSAKDAGQVAGDTASGILDTAKHIKKDAKPRVDVSLNVIPSMMNEDVSNPYAESQINDTAYHFEAALVYESDKKDIFNIAESTEAYFSLHYVSRINTGEDDSSWADHTDEVAFVYGHTYYSQDNYQGFGYGWYAGLGFWSTSDAYYWYDNSYVYDDDELTGIEVLAAATVFYKYKIEDFFVQPRVVFSIDTENLDFMLAPQVMVGYRF